MSYEREQARLRKLWEELEREEVADDDEEELAQEEDIVENRDADSETEEEADSDEGNEENISAVTLRVPQFLGKDGTSKWLKRCPNKRVRTRRDNIIRIHLPGVRAVAKNAKSVQECWSLFFTEEMLNSIVDNTNKYISNVMSKYTRERNARVTDIVELKALFGLLYLAGVLKSSRLSTEELWDRNSTGVERFWLTMSQQRFLFLLRCLRFDDLTTREARKQIDKLAPIRDIFDSFVQNCKSAYTIGENATIDEKLEAFRGRCGFKQYIPNKPNKYGIKIFALVDANMFYVSNLEVYVGQQPEGPFRVRNDTCSIVQRMVAPISGTNRNVTCDNWFTTFPLINILLRDHRLTYVGTVKKNKPELPQDFVNTKPRALFSSMFGFQKDITIVSYIPKKGRNVILASSQHHDDEIDMSTNEKVKPSIITFYNQTKGGVDTLDKLCATYDVARNTRRWPMVIFYALLNMAGTNSQIMFAANNPDAAPPIRRQFLKTLAINLSEDHLKRRSLQQNLPRVVRERRQEVAGTSLNVVQPEEIPQGIRKRCHCCLKDSKTKYYCFKCKKFICLSHSQFLCLLCRQTFESINV